MKKLLALVLALVMVLSLCVTSNAAYKDAADVDFDEAVEVMSAVGVFQGSDGKFDPKANLTREQAAKIVTYMLLGKKNADTLVTIAAPFADVEATRWSAGSIAYCYNEGILAGVGAGKFDPAGQLTGLAFAKMMLTALGYDAEVEGLTGASWSINTAKLALQAGLTDGMDDVSLSAPMTREQAAKMAFNTEKATMVEYDTKTSISIGGANVVIAGSKAKDVENNKNDYRGAAYFGPGNENVMQFCEQYCKDLKLVAGTTSDDFDRPAVEWKYKTESVGTYTAAPTATFEGKVTKAAMYDLIGKDVFDDLDGIKAVLDVYIDGTEQDGSGSTTNYADKAGVAKNNSGAAYGTGNGSYTEVFVDDDGNGGYAKITVVIINTYLMQANGDYNAKTEKLTATKLTGPASATVTLEAEDWAVEDFKKNDYILYTYANSAIQSVEKAELVSGNVDSYAFEDSVVLDGTTYKYDLKAYTAGTANSKSVAYAIDETATVVLDKQGYILYVDETSVDNDDVVFLLDTGASGFDTIAKLLFVDGTTKTVTLNSKSVAAAAGGTPAFYAYTVKDNGEYKLTAYTHQNTKTVAQNTKAIENKANVGSVVANSSTVYIVKDSDGDYNVYTGIKNAPTVTSAPAGGNTTVYYVTNHDNNKALYVYYDASATAAVIDEASSSTSELTYVMKVGSTKFVDSDKNNYKEVTVLVNGEQKVLKAECDGTGALTESTELVAGKLLKSVKTNSDGYVIDAVEATGGDYFNKTLAAEAAGAFAYDDGVVTIKYNDGSDKTQSWFVDTDVVYVVVTAGDLLGDGNASFELTETTCEGLESFVNGYTAAYSFYVVENDDNELTALYVRITASTEV